MMNEPFERFREDRQMSSESTRSSRTGWLGQSNTNKYHVKYDRYFCPNNEKESN